MIAEKKIKSGRLLESEFYPAFSDGRRMPVRTTERKETSASQKKYNQIQAQKKAIRLINANFDTGDIKLDPTFKPEDAPLTEQEAKRVWNNFKRAVKRRREAELKRVNKLLERGLASEDFIKKAKKLKEEFKYYCSLEETVYKSGIHKGKSNWHFHIIMTGGLSRDIIEDLWPSKAKINADRFQPERFGPEAAARYLTKDLNGSRKILRSRNLDLPKEKKKDSHLSRNAMARIATLRADDKEYWENRYKGYKFLRCYARFNEYNSNWYISVVMYKTDSDILPKWDIPELLDFSW